MPGDGMSLFTDGCLITRTPRGWTIAWLRFLWRFGLCSGRRVNPYGMEDRYFDDRVRKTLERLRRAQSSRFVFRTPHDLLRALGLPAERPVATAIDWALQPPLEHPRSALPPGASLPVSPHEIGQSAAPE